MTCEEWDVVLVPFPFSEKPGEKKRPALVLSKPVFNERGHSVLAMITTVAHDSWPGDTTLSGYQPAGLHTPCIVRLKLFTLDNRLILRRIGRLTPEDRRAVGSAIRSHLF